MGRLQDVHFTGQAEKPPPAGASQKKTCLDKFRGFVDQGRVRTNYEYPKSRLLAIQSPEVSLSSARETLHQCLQLYVKPAWT
jgi:hypothetical protein